MSTSLNCEIDLGARVRWQAGLPHAGASMGERVAYQGGFAGLYRGAAPGVFGGGLRNACAMAAMANWQRLATHLGLRNEE